VIWDLQQTFELAVGQGFAAADVQAVGWPGSGSSSRAQRAPTQPEDRAGRLGWLYSFRCQASCLPLGEVSTIHSHLHVPLRGVVVCRRVSPNVERLVFSGPEGAMPELDACVGLVYSGRQCRKSFLPG